MLRFLLLALVASSTTISEEFCQVPLNQHFTTLSRRDKGDVSAMSVDSNFERYVSLCTRGNVKPVVLLHFIWGRGPSDYYDKVYRTINNSIKKHLIRYIEMNGQSDTTYFAPCPSSAQMNPRLKYPRTQNPLICGYNVKKSRFQPIFVDWYPVETFFPLNTNDPDLSHLLESEYEQDIPDQGGQYVVVCEGSDEDVVPLQEKEPNSGPPKLITKLHKFVSERLRSKYED